MEVTMNPKDIITEEDFNAQVARRGLKSPQKDSPGDTATDMNEEVNMGVDYEPTKDVRRKKDVPAFDQGHNHTKL
jgi:hypothetical protein